MARLVEAGGAPPRAWGGRETGRRQNAQARSTPTSVGRTGDRTHQGMGHAEHPHERGADQAPRLIARRLAGAPPRAWGGHRHRAGTRQLRRSTPTSVGRTVAAHPVPAVRAEHPHERGADNVDVLDVAGRDGAPPRAWGGRCRVGDPLRLSRSTPTSVGRTYAPSPQPHVAPEHPHERGADVRMMRPPVPWSGAPPRAWGGRGARGRSRDS